MKTIMMWLMWLFTSVLVVVTDAGYSSKDVRCSVCKIVIQEMEKEISKVNPKKKINLGHRIDEEGKVVDKTKQFARSEVHISELMDVICEKMENYVRATHKKSKKFEVIPLMMDSGGMNPKFGDYDVVQDADLNQSLKFNCEGIVEEFDAEISKILQEKTENSEFKVCVEATGLCNETTAEKKNVEL